MSVTWQKLVFIGFFQLNALLATGQDPLANSIAMGTGNVAEMKRQAEAGKPEAQVKLGDLLSFNQRKTDALEWYRKAAYNGSTEATYRVGEMLLFGAVGNSKAQSIQPSPAEGVLWTFQAATNFHPGACLNMSKAYQQGIGVGINAVEAYAWLQLYVDTPTGSQGGARVYLNQMALNMDTHSIGRAEEVAAKFKAGSWERPVTVEAGVTASDTRPRTIAEAVARSHARSGADTNLTVSGIMSGRNGSYAIVQGKIMAEGDTAMIPFKSGMIRVKCRKIETNSVVIAVDGEDQPRTLSFK
jgi:hypothetical protein